MQQGYGYGGPQGQPPGYRPPPSPKSGGGVVKAVLLGLGGIIVLGAIVVGLAKNKETENKKMTADLAVQASASAAAAASADREASELRRKHEEAVTKYKSMVLSKRLDAVKAACSGTECVETELAAILEASTAEERPKIQTEIDKRKKDAKAREEKAEGEQDVKDREKFAKGYEEKLLKRGKNPRSVSAVGPAKTTLHVEGAFCSKQFVYEFVNAVEGGAAKTSGFKKIDCNDGIVTTTGTFE